MNQKIMNYQNYFNQPNTNPNPNPNHNMNFNKCTYTPKERPEDLYEAYEGFIRGNMFPDLYNQYKVSKPFDVEPMNEQAQLLTYVDALSFAAHDINLYLDNFPDDHAMIQLYNHYRTEAERAIKEYENHFGPLYVTSNATYKSPWSWNSLPWPWEN